MEVDTTRTCCGLLTRNALRQQRASAGNGEATYKTTA